MRGMRTLTLATLLTLGAAMAAPAMADDRRGRGHDRDRHGWDDRDHRYRDDRRHRDDRHYRIGDRGYKVKHRHGKYRHHGPVYVVHQPPRVVYHRSAHRGPPPWARGRHYGYQGYAPTYVVRDYGYYGLRSPPRGHYWRRSDAGDFLLVAAATGIIADLILSR